MISIAASGILMGQCVIQCVSRLRCGVVRESVITMELGQMNGEPCIRGLRLTVRRVLEALAIYPDRAELKREYPELEDEDIRQALAFAATLLDDRVLPLPHDRMRHLPSNGRHGLHSSF